MEVDSMAVKSAVKESGYKTKWLAGQIGVSARTLSRFLNGKQKLGKPALILLFQVLKISHDDLKTQAS